METSLNKLITGYHRFKEKYATGDDSIMQRLSDFGQQPEHMIVSCCDSRVDPAVIFQTHPGELFTTRNVANIVPPYEADEKHHGTSAALEFGVCYLQVKHLIILGHSQCGGIQAACHPEALHQNDFITRWVSLIDSTEHHDTPDALAKHALRQSYQNCLTFPWIQQRVNTNQLTIHLWFFNIQMTQIDYFNFEKQAYLPLR